MAAVVVAGEGVGASEAGGSASGVGAADGAGEVVVSVGELWIAISSPPGLCRVIP